MISSFIHKSRLPTWPVIQTVQIKMPGFISFMMLIPNDVIIKIIHLKEMAIHRQLEICNFKLPTSLNKAGSYRWEWKCLNDICIHFLERNIDTLVMEVSIDLVDISFVVVVDVRMGVFLLYFPFRKMLEYHSWAYLYK